jgi:hypothetical protein
MAAAACIVSDDVKKKRREYWKKEYEKQRESSLREKGGTDKKESVEKSFTINGGSHERANFERLNRYGFFKRYFDNRSAKSTELKFQSPDFSDR